MIRKVGTSPDRDPAVPSVERQVAVRFRLRVVLVASVMIVAGFIGYVLGRAHWFWKPGERAPLPVEITGTALAAAGCAVAMVALVYAIRTGRAGRNRRSALWALTRSQRRSLKAQVMRNTIEPGTDLATLQLMASGLADQLWSEWQLVGVAALIGGEALINRAMPPIAGVVMAAICVGVWLMSREIKAARRFMLDYPSGRG